MLDTSVDTVRVLIIEDDPTVAEVVARYLEREGYRSRSPSDGAAGLRRALAETPDLVVLDLMLPSLGGMEVFRRLRAVSPVPVIMLTARGEEADRVAGLELGADDYVAKPFSPRELMARVKTILRRADGPRCPRGPRSAAPTVPMPARLRAGDLEIDLRATRPALHGERVALTAKEFDLLAYLMSHPRRAFRRESCSKPSGGSRSGDTSTVTVHVRRLRAKIEPDPSVPRYVCTVWGVGYRFEP